MTNAREKLIEKDLLVERDRKSYSFTTSESSEGAEDEKDDRAVIHMVILGTH
jgi:hypothetical protein